ncbi:DUF2752 domain-containing protein [uncultured Aquimarina sp.]|uniref:DUF2752 domain-containing protein n=1 Tax=uncultured Aquimarina sp. TaxID=575652 RepID=UPI00345B8F76
MNEIITFLENNLLFCPSKQFIRIECLGCGLQRSFILLIKGDFLNSIIMYPALIPMFMMIGYLVSHIYFNFKNGASILKYFYFLNIILIVANYIIKQLSYT